MGRQSFEEMGRRNDPLVDKTAPIGQRWRTGDDVTLLCLPRRFGKAHEWPPCDQGDRHVVAFDELGIHTAPEPEIAIADWDRTYFLTKC